MEQQEKCSFSGENFLIRIHFHDNTTWQGTITWLNEKKSQTFRSLLEMIMLLQEAVGKDNFTDSGLRTWKAVDETIIEVK